MSAKVLKSPSNTVLKGTPSRRDVANNETVTCVLSKRSSSNNIDKPSPLDLTKFLPWVCLQYELTIEITVKRAVAEKYVSRRKVSSVSERKSSGRMKSSERKAFSSDGMKSTDRRPESQNVPPTSKKAVPTPAPYKSSSAISSPSDKVPITAYYDVSGYLVEVAIIKSPVKIQQKLIKCINMCLPFHPSLLKLTITKGGMTSEVLYEIAKMLPLSFITDVCLDDCYVKEGNYYVLLDNISPLKVLSLKKCQMNDIALKEIATRMDFGQSGSGLTILDLGSNHITDTGAWYLGDMLRSNRTLLHLSLSDNRITDKGLKYIMNPLKEFEMRQEEVFGMKQRRFSFIQGFGTGQFGKENNRHSHDVSNQATQVHFRGKAAKKKTVKKKKHSSVDLEKVSAVTIIERDEFTDIFDDHNIVVRGNNMYCIGNLTLCSLNLAYNQLDYESVKKIFDVVIYQSTAVKLPPRTGLMRLVLEGNLIPEGCDELHEIGLLLSSVISCSSQSARNLKSRSKF